MRVVRYMIILCIFFFSSRRRHTRFDCDWSSDVCSSDLLQGFSMDPTVEWKDGAVRLLDQSRLPESVEFLDCRDYQTVRSEEHTSELQSQSNLVCRLLLEKKKKAISLFGRPTCSRLRVLS